jgi:hypothetical protein
MKHLSRWLMVACGLLGACTSSAMAGDTLPMGLAGRLYHDPMTFSVRLDWKSVGNLPAVATAVTAGLEGTPPEIPLIDVLWRPASEILAITGLSTSDLVEVWAFFPDPNYGSNTEYWARVARDDEWLTAHFEEGNTLMRVPGTERLFVKNPGDEVLDQMRRQADQLPDRTLADFIVTDTSDDPHLWLVGEGWFAISLKGRDRFVPPDEPGIFLPEDMPPPPAPWDQLQTLASENVAALAVDMPEIEPFDSGDVATMSSLTELRRRARYLDSPENIPFHHARDFTVTISETDGGLGLDCRIPFTDEDTIEQRDQVRTFLEFMSGFVQYLSLPRSRALAADLGRATVVERSDHIRASTVINRSALAEAIGFEIGRQEEMATIRARIKELIDRAE